MFTQLQLEKLERVKKTLTENGLKKTHVLKSDSVDAFLVDLIGGDDPSIFVHSRVEAEKWFGKDTDLIIWEDALLGYKEPFEPIHKFVAKRICILR